MFATILPEIASVSASVEKMLSIRVLDLEDVIWEMWELLLEKIMRLNVFY